VPKELIIVARDQPELYESLKREFARDIDVTVVIDRRVGERRASTAPTEAERRDQDRRSYQEASELKSRGFVRVLAGAVEALADEHPEINRTGPPTPQNVSGAKFAWTLELNRFPSKVWREFFVDTRDQSIDCNPAKVRFFRNTLIFDSEEKMIPVWIPFITRWMLSANERYLRYLQGQRKAKKIQEEHSRDAKDRLKEAAERFKHL
jgi:hypothetical protein